jgi:hypothetical protein
MLDFFSLFTPQKGLKSPFLGHFGPILSCVFRASSEVPYPPSMLEKRETSFVRRASRTQIPTRAGLTVKRKNVVTFQSFEQAPSHRPRGRLDTASSGLFVA